MKLDRRDLGELVTANPSMRCPACERFLLDALPSFTGAVRVHHHCGAHIIVLRNGEQYVMLWDQGEGALPRVMGRYQDWLDEHTSA